jgi:hypothetical protein
MTQIIYRLCAPVIFFAFAAPTLALAQFQPPTQDELKMTSDPKNPGVAAVYLNVEEIANDPMHFQSVYKRIKVLTEKGKELATVEIPYVRGNRKITDIKGRTIHEDGTIVPLVVKPEDLMVSKSGDQQFGRKVFTLPSVEVGSILEYSYEERYDDEHFSSPHWEIQRQFPVRKAHYEFTPFKAFLPGSQNATSRYLIDEHGNKVNTLMWWPVLPAGASVKTDVAGRYSVDVSDIPPSPNEEWMPPQHSADYKVMFYYTSAHSAAEFWNAEAKRWSKDVDHFAEPSKPIKDAVDGIVTANDSELDKAKKLYKAVQALDNTDFSRKKSETELKDLKQKEAKRADEIWAQKSGSGEQIAMLYLAMARAAGLHAFAMKVADRERTVFDPGYMSTDQLDDTVIGLAIGDKLMAVDPGEKMCPFQLLHWRHLAASGMRQSENNKFVADTPASAYPDNKLYRKGEINLDEQGTITGTLQFTMTGELALRWRQAALRNDSEEVKKQFGEWANQMVPEGVEAHLDHFLGLDDEDVVLVAVIHTQGALGTATAKRMMVPGFFFETRGSHPFVGQATRQTMVDMHYGEIVADQITYHLPSGFAVESVPQDNKITWAGHAILTDKSVQSPGNLTVGRSLARAFTFAKPEEYQDLRGFYQKMAEADQQQVVLTRAANEKGN